MHAQTTEASRRPADEATDRFVAAVHASERRGRGGTAGTTGLAAGGLLMAAGVVGAFVQYSTTLSMDDSRDIASAQVLALAFLTLCVVGAALFVAGSLGRVLRLWLLRQVLEGRQRDQALASALHPE